LDGELPEDVAAKFYGIKEAWWIIFFFNGLKNAFTDWPLSGEQILYLTDLLVTKENKYSRDGYFVLLSDANEAKSRLEILDKTQVPNLINQFRQSIKDSKQRATDTSVII